MTKKVRIKFSADLVVEADSLEEARQKWEGMPLWSKEAKECGAEFSDILLVEDAETYDNLIEEWI